MIERICLILLLNVLFYAKTLTYKYASDDIPAYNRPKDPVKWRHWIWVIEGRARHSPQVDHALTMMLHALVCVGVYLGFGANDVSFLAAILFSVNPITNQGSVWIAGRGYVLSGLGVLWSMAIPAFSPLLLLGASYYNVGFVLPLALIGSTSWWVLCCMPFVWLLHWKRFNSNVADKVRMEMFEEDKKFKPEKFVLAIKTFGFYLVHTIVPIKNSFYHSFLQSAAGSMKHKAYSMKDRFFWIGVASLICMAFYMITNKWSIVSLGILWWCIGIIPFCNFCRIQQEIAERYCYVPAIGMMVVLASLIINNPMAQAVFFTMYATKMWFWADAYTDDYYLVEHSCLNSPDAWFAWHVRAMKRWEAQSHQEAVVLWAMARMISPKEFKINFNIATALVMSNNPDHKKEAKRYMEIAENNIPAGQEKQAGELIANWKKGNWAIVL